jgi:hypothetical protein
VQATGGQVFSSQSNIFCLPYVRIILTNTLAYFCHSERDEAKKGFLTLTPEGSHDMLSEGTVVFNVRDHEWNKKIEKVSNPANGATRIEMSKTKS